MIVLNKGKRVTAGVDDGREHKPKAKAAFCASDSKQTEGLDRWQGSRTRGKEEPVPDSMTIRSS